MSMERSNGVALRLYMFSIKRIAREDTAGRAHQHFQDIELEGGDLDRFAVGENLARARDRCATPFTSRRASGFRRTRFQPAQNRANAGGQLSRVERLGQVVVGAELQADDAVHIFAAGREHDDRHFAFLAQAAQDFEAIHARQHHVQQDDRVVALQRLVQAALAVVLAFQRRIPRASEIPPAGRKARHHRPPIGFAQLRFTTFGASGM